MCYNHDMNTTKEFNYIDNFLHNLYLNQEVSTTETLNFLKVYGDYILKHNDINPEYLQIDIHQLKEMPYGILANIYQDEKNPQHFIMNLRKQNFGHEMQHVVQFVNHPHLMYKFFDKEDKYDEIYDKTIINKMLTKKELDRFERAMIKCDKALHLNTKTEKSADTSAYAYISILLEESFNCHNHEIGYMNFLLEYLDKVLYDRSCRKKDYKKHFDEYRRSIKVLTKKYGIKKEDLLIP